jgi:hypothetical protein
MNPVPLRIRKWAIDCPVEEISGGGGDNQLRPMQVKSQARQLTDRHRIGHHWAQRLCVAKEKHQKREHKNSPLDCLYTFDCWRASFFLSLSLSLAGSRDEINGRERARVRRLRQPIH